MDNKPLQQRKLAAILFADIVGYTALMQSDERLALAHLQKFKQSLEQLVPANKGEIIQFYGDGCLATFHSSLEAVACAKKLQTQYQSKPTVPVRIGIHSGDVVFKEGNVFGDAVNMLLVLNPWESLALFCYPIEYERILKISQGLNSLV